MRPTVSSSSARHAGVGDVIGIGAQVGEKREQVPAGRRQGQLPSRRRRSARRILSLAAMQHQGARRKLEPSAKYFLVGHVFDFGQRQNERRLARVVVFAQTLEEPAVDRRIGASVDPFDEQIVLKPVERRDVVALEIGVVRRQLRVIAPTPNLIDLEPAVAEDMALKRIVAVFRAEAVARLAVTSAGLDIIRARLVTLAPLALEQRAVVLGVHRRQQQVVAWVEREVIRHFDEIAEVGRVPDAGHQEARLRAAPADRNAKNRANKRPVRRTLRRTHLRIRRAPSPDCRSRGRL